MLGVKRTQFMITPALAVTAHAAQGRTMGAVIADLERGRGVSWMSSYVAITRVRRRENLLIFRPFDRKPYNEGEMAGTQKLLQVLRGGPVDWENWEAQLMPRDQCERCRRRLLVEAFTKYEFRRKDRPAFCKECTAEMKSVGEKWCKTCKAPATKTDKD